MVLLLLRKSPRRWPPRLSVGSMFDTEQVPFLGTDKFSRSSPGLPDGLPQLDMHAVHISMRYGYAIARRRSPASTALRRLMFKFVARPNDELRCCTWATNVFKGIDAEARRAALVQNHASRRTRPVPRLRPLPSSGSVRRISRREVTYFGSKDLQLRGQAGVHFPRVTVASVAKNLLAEGLIFKSGHAVML